MNKTKIAILSISLMNILMNAGIVPIMSVLAAAIPDATPTAMKFTLSISSIFCVAFSLLTGYLDRFFPKKTLLTVGLLLYGAGGMGSGLVNSMAGLLFTRAIMGIGGGICLPLASAYIADFYEGEERKETIGYSLVAANLAAMLLPLAGTWLAGINWRLSGLIYVVTLFSLALAWLYIPAQSPARTAAAAYAAKQNQSNTPKEKTPLFTAPVIWAAFLYFVAMLLFVSLPSNFSMYVKSEGIGTPATAAWVSAISTLSSMLISMRFAKIFRLANRWMLAIGYLVCGAGFLVMGGLPGLWPAVIGNALIGGSLGMLHPLFPYMAAQGSPRERSTSAMSLVSSGFRMGTFVSPFFFLAANSLAGVTSIRGEFRLSGMILTGVAVAVAAVLFAKRDQRSA